MVKRQEKYIGKAILALLFFYAAYLGYISGNGFLVLFGIILGILSWFSD
jgi:uncharacterized protein (DUF58 family)